MPSSYPKFQFFIYRNFILTSINTFVRIYVTCVRTIVVDKATSTTRVDDDEEEEMLKKHNMECEIELSIIQKLLSWAYFLFHALLHTTKLQ
jgi:hypothetical protein